MTNLEVHECLRAEFKPYALVKMNRHYYSEMMKRIRLGKCKPATVTKFFNQFGYTGKWDSWEKTS